MLECLQNIVGLSNQPCECYVDGRPVDYNESRSGLYLTDLMPLAVGKSATDCANGGVWDILQNGRRMGIQQLTTDLTTAINQNQRFKYRGFEGAIGQDAFSAFDTPPNAATYRAIRLEPARTRGGVLVVSGVSCAIDYLGALPISVPVSMYSSRDMSTPITSANLVVSLNRKWNYVAFDAPVVIELNNLLDIENEAFYFVFELPAGARLANNQLEKGCGCGGIQQRAAISENAFWDFMRAISTVSANSIPALHTNALSSESDARGMRVHCSLSCDPLGWLCKVSTAWTMYQAVPVAGYNIQFGAWLARALQHISAALAMDIVIRSQNVNRYTLLGSDGLKGARQAALTKYKEDIMQIARVFPYTETDCIACAEDRRISVNPIIV